MAEAAQSKTRVIALIAALLLAVGAFGPWQATFLVDRTGIEGDGVFTLGAAVIAGLVVYLAAAGSTWNLLAGVLAGLAAVVAIVDLVRVANSSSEVFGRNVHLVSPGWGLWVSAVAAVVLGVAAVTLWTEDAG